MMKNIEIFKQNHDFKLLHFPLQLKLPILTLPPQEIPDMASHIP